MNSRSCRWLIVSALLITASGGWAQQSAPPASEQKPETFTTSHLCGTPQCSLPPAYDQKSVATLKQQASSGKAAEQGSASAQYFLGLMYATGTGVPKDSTQAATWWRKGAEQGCAVAQACLGDLYKKGWGVPQDYTRAALWYREASDQGDVDAQYNLGTLYLYGLGVP